MNMSKIESIKEILSDGFETNLYNASIFNLNDKKNKLRYNNFAYSIRELSRHLLHRLAPDENVMLCAWFKVDTDNGKPSRRQRVKYAIQGGISDEILSNLGFDVEILEEEIASIIDTINSLSKYTHLNPKTFDMSDEDINESSSVVLSKFEFFASSIKMYRNRLIEFLDGKIDEVMMNTIIYNFFQNVDMLAPHHTPEYCEVSNYSISEINESEIVVYVEGNVEFVLHYGSRQERREGDGLDLNQSFPFNTKISYPIDKDFPSDNYNIEEYDVDTESWYGEITDDEIDKLIDEEHSAI